MVRSHGQFACKELVQRTKRVHMSSSWLTYPEAHEEQYPGELVPVLHPVRYEPGPQVEQSQSWPLPVKPLLQLQVSSQDESHLNSIDAIGKHKIITQV